MSEPSSDKFLVLNGDGFVVAEYEELGHAIESARVNAEQAAYDGDLTNFYTVSLPDFTLPAGDGPFEFRARDVDTTDR